MVWAKGKADDQGLSSWYVPVCPGPGLTYSAEHPVSPQDGPFTIAQLSPYLAVEFDFQVESFQTVTHTCARAC